ncbi:MAG: hypothetical protein FJX56_12620 [Alphaproteobacteria bacterium]|nr:hypothetical protein [Alphaproteobacteria bacterium]
MRALLVSLAAPQGLTFREMQWLWRWSSRWSNKVGIARFPTAPAQWHVDLAGGSGAHWRAGEESGTALRFLDTSTLAHTLRKRIRQVTLGIVPASLGLGKHIAPPASLDLLKYLLRHWCEMPATRQFPRRGTLRTQAAAEIEVAVGIAAVHLTISG